MPQISKIRIVNFNYNDGNRFIPDELYDLASPESGEALNALFNLNNGGGKTVLVQLMMQPVHPKAMAGGRRIEEYFSHTGDHSYILIEWNLDGSKEKLLTGISIAASSSASTEDNQRGNSIKYYTFTTCYETYSAYSISSLDLSNNENGNYVPAAFEYVREKAKTSRGTMTYYSSDDAVKWADYLAEYGIYRTEWESVIEALNKDEGGLNQYFDEAKTSDKLIAKFFIPAIEQKLMSSASKGSDCSLETMLINYAKKITEKESVIEQRKVNNKLLGDLKTVSEISDELYNANDMFMTSVSEIRGFAASLSKKIKTVDTEMDRINKEKEKKNGFISQIEYEKKSKDYYVATAKYDQTKTAMEEAFSCLEKSKETLATKKHEEDILQCAKLFRQIKDSDAQIKEFKNRIEDMENKSEDAERIANLKYSVSVKANEANSEQQNKKEVIGGKINKESDAVKELEEAKNKVEAERDAANERYNLAEAHLNVAKGNTDKRIKSLQILATRKFSGFYETEEIEAERLQREQIKKEQESAIVDIRNRIEKTNKRIGQIPQDIAALKIEHSDVSRSLKEAVSKLEEYESAFKQIVRICEKYSYETNIAFSNVLRDAIRRDLDAIEADITTKKQILDSLNEKRKAAETGNLHILPEIMTYVNSTGLNLTTGEEYICGLIADGTISTDRADEILSAFPEMAYALLFDNEKEIQRLLSAGNIEWLPAVVPLFTMEQVDHILDGTKEKMTFLSAYDKNFFEDREGYVNHLKGGIDNLEERIQQLHDHLEEVKEDKHIVDCFNYDVDWRKEQERLIASLKFQIGELEEKKKELENEKLNLEEESSNLTKKHDECNGLIQEAANWLKSFGELSQMLSDEQVKYTEEQDAFIAKKTVESNYKEACDALEKHNNELDSMKKESENIDASIKDINNILENIGNVQKAELLEGNYSTLYEQYKVCLRIMGESLEGLRNSLVSVQKSKQDYEAELAGYSCKESEYVDASLPIEALLKVRQQREACEKDCETKQKEYTSKNGDFTASKEVVKQAKSALADHEGVPLPPNEIGDNFLERTLKAQEEIDGLTTNYKELDTKKRSLEKIYDRIDNALDGLSMEIIAVDVSLSEKPDEQWKVLKSNLDSSRKEYNSKREEFNRKVQETVSDYKDIVLPEIVTKLAAIGGMLNDAEIKGDCLFTISESISAMIESITKINSKIETDLREIDNDFNDLVNQCFLQGKRVYEDLRMIARSSKAHIYEGKPQTPMLKIDLPEEKELSEEASRVSILNEIEKGANEIKEMLANNSEEKYIQKRAKIVVGSERLLHKYIIRETVPVKVYKIDLNSANSSYKRWEDTLTQSSGAEKFVVFFSVVLTLMNYTRATSGVVSKDTRSVLILDNPFGKITSAHLLKPMFEIAKHFNVQLICLSDINKSDVTSCFDCVIKLVIKQQNLSNFEIMTHEGNEKIEHGYYKIMNGQLSLF